MNCLCCETCDKIIECCVLLIYLALIDILIDVLFVYRDHSILKKSFSSKKCLVQLMPPLTHNPNNHESNTTPPVGYQAMQKGAARKTSPCAVRTCGHNVVCGQYPINGPPQRWVTLHSPRVQTSSTAKWVSENPRGECTNTKRASELRQNLLVE